jgi:hypothetical protein
VFRATVLWGCFVSIELSANGVYESDTVELARWSFFVGMGAVGGFLASYLQVAWPRQPRGAEAGRSIVRHISNFGFILGIFLLFLKLSIPWIPHHLGFVPALFLPTILHTAAYFLTSTVIWQRRKPNPQVPESL